MQNLKMLQSKVRNYQFSIRLKLLRKYFHIYTTMKIFSAGCLRVATLWETLNDLRSSNSGLPPPKYDVVKSWIISMLYILNRYSTR